MYFRAAFFTAVLPVYVLGQTGSVQTSTASRLASSRTSLPTVTTEPSTLPTSGLAPCEVISAYQDDAAFAEATDIPIPPAAALACLNSVPLDSARSSDLVDYIGPYLQFQSTLTYLKTPPTGYLVPGVDIIGGLATIKQNLQNNAYSSQFAFEKDLFTLLNVFPHEGHLSYALPLFQVFAFGTGISLISVSEDGTSLPKLYLSDDLVKGVDAGYPSSAISSIDGIAAFDYIENLSMTTANSPQDPDAIYNRMFRSSPRASLGLFYNGAWVLGMNENATNVTFENGTSLVFGNVAYTALDFASNDIKTGTDLHIATEVPSTNTLLVRKHERRDILETEHLERLGRRKSSSSSSSQSLGYPTNPVEIHSSGGYVAGYFLIGTSDTAVLSVRAFQSRLEDADPYADNQEMQEMIKTFFARCTKAGRSKLIIDLQGNSGGSVFSGYDLFKQLFPSMEPFAGTRFRATPAVDFMGQTFTTFDEYDRYFSTSYQTQAQVDQSGKDFPTWSAMFGPDNLYGDDFTSVLRYNLSDPVSTYYGNGIYISGYGALSANAKSAQPFQASDIVMLYDGICASTCALFSELMKSQGGVRSIAMGGRPSTGPMQAVGGTKGAQVQSFALLQQYANISSLLADPPSGAGLPSLSAPPMYPALGDESPGLNWRNNYSPDDVDTPLQFKYEAANCRLFFRAEDIFNMTLLWQQVYNATWGTQGCVEGSSVGTGGRMPDTVGHSVAYDVRWLSNVTAPTGPGAVGAATVNGASTPSSTRSGTSSPSASSTQASLGTVVMPDLRGMVVMGVAAGVALWAC